KGYAVGSAALAAFLLFNAYLEETGIAKFGVNIAHPETFIGGFIGAALVFLFTAYAIRAVGRAAWAIIKDVRDQFRENPGIMAGTAKPDYARSVDIVTRSALGEIGTTRRNSSKRGTWAARGVRPTRRPWSAIPWETLSRTPRGRPFTSS